jgi:hypothetical protein
MRVRFITYINEKRLKGEKIVQPLDLDYFHQQKPVLPGSFKAGLIILMGYFLSMNGVLWRFAGMFSRVPGEKSALPSWIERLEPQRLNHKKFKDQSLLERSYASLTYGKGDTSGLDENCDFLRQFLNLPVQDVIKYLSGSIRYDEEKMTHLFTLFDVRKSTPLSEKNIFLFHVASVLAEDSKLLVINDFLGNQSFSFYEKFEEALKYILNTGKTVLFLTLKSFKLKSEDKYLDEEDIQTVNLEYHSLR